METNKRKTWIDFLRGICMLAILLDHTEIYYTGTNIINYNVYVTDALYLFFFISGYLIYKDGKAFDLKKKNLINLPLSHYTIFHFRNGLGHSKSCGTQ